MNDVQHQLWLEKKCKTCKCFVEEDDGSFYSCLNRKIPDRYSCVLLTHGIQQLCKEKGYYEQR